MKKVLVVIISIVLVIVVVVGLVWNSHKTEELAPEDTLDKGEEILTIDEKAIKQLKSMSLDEKIGQLFMISIPNTKMNDSLRQEITTFKPGGVILFKNNIERFSDTAKLISDLQDTASIPLFIGIDQEGGIVQRIKNLEDAPVLSLPPMMQVGNTHDSELSYQVGTVIGEEIRPFGINLDFAPILDIYSNPKNAVIGNRAFGKTKEQVVEMALPLAQGIKDSGVIPVYKHFPGHGDTVADSHKELPIIQKTKEELENLELAPFEKAIEEGADMIMVAHIALPNITFDNTPASLSKVIVQDLLRDEMGFDGVVITDAVNMKAISDHYTTKEMSVKALTAGVDIILMPLDLEKAISAIKEAIAEGMITEERTDESVLRILKLKYKYELDQAKSYDKSVIGSEAHRAIIDKIK